MLFQQSTGVYWGKEVHVLVEKQTPLGKKQFMSWQKGRRHQEKSSSCPSRKEVESNEKKADHFLAEKYTCPFMSWQKCRRIHWEESSSCPGRKVDVSNQKSSSCPSSKVDVSNDKIQFVSWYKSSSYPGRKASGYIMKKAFQVLVAKQTCPIRKKQFMSGQKSTQVH